MIAPSRLPRNSFEAYAIAYGGRQIGLFSAWAFPLAFVAGAPPAIILAMASGVDPAIPAGLLGAFALMSVLGWLISAPWRFGAKPISAVKYPFQVATKTEGNVSVAVTTTGILAAACLALFFIAPYGRELGAFVAYVMALGMGCGLIAHGMRVTTILKYCPENYAAWLTRTGNQSGPAHTFYRHFLSRSLITPEEVYAAASAGSSPK